MNEILFKKADEKLIKLINLIQESIKGTHFEGKTYLVGGCVRDLILGLPAKDVDIVIELPNGGMTFASYMAMKHQCYVAGTNPVVFENYGTAKFQLYKDEELRDIEIECVQTKKRSINDDVGTLKEDAFRRDLTINAIYYNISDGKLYDPTLYGVDDLAKSILRCPSTLLG